MTQRLESLPLGVTVRFPYSGLTAIVVRHGASGTVVRPVGERHAAFEATVPGEDTTKRVAFVAPLTTTVVCSTADVEVL